MLSAIYRNLKLIRFIKKINPEVLHSDGLNKNIKTPPSYTDVLKRRVIHISVGGFIFSGVYYLHFLAKRVGHEDHDFVWPLYVRQRIQETYTFLTFSFAFNGLAMVLLSKIRILQTYLSKTGPGPTILRLCAVIFSGVIVHKLPFSDRLLSLKQLSWIIHCHCMGMFLFPIFMLSGRAVRMTSLYSLGVASGFSSAALGAPNETALYVGGLIGIGLGFLLISQIGLLFFKPTFQKFKIMNYLCIYGGTTLLSCFVMYDARRVIANVENCPYSCHPPFDPINNALGIYSDAARLIMGTIDMLVAPDEKY